MSEGGPQPTSIDELFDALCDPRRRETIAILAERRETMAVSDLAEALAERELDGARASGADDIQVTLRHLHLPKLAESGLVEYEPRESTVRLEATLGGKRIENARDWLRRLDDAARDRSETP